MIKKLKKKAKLWFCFSLYLHAGTFQRRLLRRCWMSGDHSFVPLMSPCNEQSATLSSFYQQLCLQNCITGASSMKPLLFSYMYTAIQSLMRHQRESNQKRAMIFNSMSTQAYTVMCSSGRLCYVIQFIKKTSPVTLAVLVLIRKDLHSSFNLSCLTLWRISLCMWGEEKSFSSE